MLKLHAYKALWEVSWLMVNEFAMHLRIETRITVYRPFHLEPYNCKAIKERFRHRGLRKDIGGVED